MFPLLWRGFLGVAILAVAAGELQIAMGDCESSQQGCEADEQLFSPKDELQGLDLLQVEVRLQSEVANSLESHPASHDKLAKADQGTVEYEVQASPPTLPYNSFADSTEGKLMVKMPQAAHEASPTSIPGEVSLVETSSRVHLETMRTLKRMVVELRSKGAGALLVAMFLLAFVCMAAILLPNFLFQRAGSDQKQQSAPQGLSPAQQLLQAPQSTSLSQSPVSAYNRSPSMDIRAPGSPGLGPPPICPSLILPHTEARFMIPVESLMRGSGELDIRGTSGRKLLHGSVTDTPEGRRCLALASCGCEEDPRVKVLAPAGASDGRRTVGGGNAMGTLELFGKGGKFYGTLEPAEGGAMYLHAEGKAVMTLEFGSDDLRMTASSMDNKMLASAGTNVQVNAKRLESQDTWKLQVKPNYDAVLIAACMIGVIVFGQT